VPLGIERAFDRPQRCRKELGTFLVIPLAVVTPDRMVVRDGSSGLYQRSRSRLFDRPELFGQRWLVTQATVGKVGCWPIGIDVGETTSDHATAAGVKEMQPLCAWHQVRKIPQGSSKVLPGGIYIASFTAPLNFEKKYCLSFVR